MKKQLGMKEMLLATVCAVGISGGAQAQFAGSLNLESIYEKGNGGFGANAGLMMPLFSAPTGMFYTMIEGGWRGGFNHGGSPVGSFGAGYRFLPAGVNGVGIGLNGSFDISQSDSRNRFYGTTAGLEIFIPGGLSISLNGYIPVLQKEKGVSSSSVNTQTTELELRDKTPGSCNPSNPQVCVPILVGENVNSTTQVTERNRWSADLQIAYRLPFFQSIDITPNVGVYMMDRDGKQLKGVEAGLDVALPLAGGVQFTMSAHGRRDREIGTVASFGLGLRVNLGPAAIVNDPRQRFLSQAPRRMALQDRARPEVRSEVTNVVTHIEEAVKWDKTDAVVTELRYVNAANQSLAHEQADALADGGILLIDGPVTLDTDKNLLITANNSGVVGGGTNLSFQGVTSGLSATYAAPGTLGDINEGAGSTIEVNLLDVQFAKNVYVNHLRLTGSSLGMNILKSEQVVVEDVKIDTVRGLLVEGSRDILVKNFQINSSIGIRIVNAEGIKIEDGSMEISGERSRGIFLNGNVGAVELKNITLQGTHQTRRFRTTAVTIGAQSSGTVSFQGISLQTWDTGYSWDDVGVMEDRGGNTATDVNLQPNAPNGTGTGTGTGGGPDSN